ncbi:MAG: methionyl-tRNA formyltransferase [Bdellovibrionales bacterium]|jgi:methionyl-tRNA formyltransferase|nr:methionyl-tRNA formyltransferase [Bdellovibrionales bacterium]
MSKVRILFMGTPEFAREALEAMLADNHFEVVGVVTQPDRPAGRKMLLTPSPVKKFALERGLRVFSPETVNTEEFRNEVTALSAESAVVVAFGQLLGDKFLALFPKKAVNVHGSLLPKWRGAAPIQRSLMAGDRETGVALQIMVKKLDAGPVLGVRKVTLSDEMTATELYPLLAKLGSELLATEYMDYLRGNLTPIEQDEALVTIAPKIQKSEAAVDWTRSAREILNLVRGLSLGPVPHARRASGVSFKLHRVVVVSEGDENARGVAGAVPGTVLRVTDAGVGQAGGQESEPGIDVQCGQGVLRLLELQPESRARMSLQDYLRGYPVEVGEVLGGGQA